MLGEDVKSLLSIARGQGLVARLLQLQLSDPAEVLFVVHDQNSFADHARSPRDCGKNRLNVIPLSGFLLTVMVPPCCVTIW